MVKEILRVLFDLGFYPEPRGLDGPLYLGRGAKLSRKQVMWDIVCWLLSALGIFARQGLNLVALDWDLSRLKPGVFVASAVVSLAIFPWAMRWINRRRPRPGLAQVAMPFAFGFFLDLASISVLRFSGKVFQGLGRGL